jgi:ribosome-associated toxin RatA of RatAB toxin-antitoxin module
LSKIRETIDIAVPVHVAYEQLCQFERYPQFMTGVQQVTQVTDDTAHWIMDLGGKTAEFDTRITENRTDELLAWSTLDGPMLSEKMSFQQINDDQCRIIAELDVDAKQLMPSDAHAQDTLNRRLKADMSSLKQFIEQGAGGSISSLTRSAGKSATPKPGPRGSAGRAAASASGDLGTGTGAGAMTTGADTTSTGRHARMDQPTILGDDEY